MAIGKRESSVADILIASEDIACVVSTEGGAIWRLEAIVEGKPIALLRPPPDDHRAVSNTGCFPLVPFGNRVEANVFDFEGRHFALSPNTSGDPHYLHGDGWLGSWEAVETASDRTRLIFEQRGPVYAYRAEQRFVACDRTLEVTMSVTNDGDVAMPFGLGWHPFFPLTPKTSLKAPATMFWTEKEGWLPDRLQPRPVDLRFDSPSPVPRRWVNNGFEGWDGKAAIAWPERGLELHVETQPRMSRYFVFVSDTVFDPNYRFDFFCFEPMTHAANGHNLPDLGGLKTLRPGGSMSATMRLTWSDLDTPNS